MGGYKDEKFSTKKMWTVVIFENAQKFSKININCASHVTE